MDSSLKFAGAVVTPTKVKSPHSNRSKLRENQKCPENLDPNVLSPGFKLCDSPSIVKSGNSAKKSASRKVNTDPVVFPSPKKKKIRERKFVIAKKKSRNEEVESSVTAVACQRCKRANGKSKCLCVAYEILRASQEEFFKKPGEVDNEVEFEKARDCDDRSENEGIKVKNESNEENDELGLKRSRERLLEEARETAPEPGSGRVMHLVKEFEKLRMMPKSGDSEQKEVKEGEDDKKVIKWALPGLQQAPKSSETQVSSSSICTSDLFLTSEILGLDSRRCGSLDSSQESISTKTSNCGRKSRRSSDESSGTQTRRHWKRKQQKATSQKPFMLRTEERGQCKEEEFMKKLQEMIEEEDKLRIPIAQGLPWTTDEPECLVKPPVKENTKPVDLPLHSDTRAVERSKFNHQVAKKMDLIEQYRMEREKQQKLAEEELIRRLRKDQVPKAQPMPYFDRPFIPRRSVKHPTIPKEPKFYLPQYKKIKSYMSLDDFCTQLE